MTAWDELVKGLTVCWVTAMAHAMATLHDMLSLASLGFATVLGAHGVWQIMRRRDK